MQCCDLEKLVGIISHCSDDYMTHAPLLRFCTCGELWLLNEEQ